MKVLRSGEHNMFRHDITATERAVPRPVRAYRLQQGRQRYVSFDVHSLLEHENEADRARPGHPFG